MTCGALVKSKSCAPRLVSSTALVLELRGTNALSFVCHGSIWAWYRQEGRAFCAASFGSSSLFVDFRPYLRKRYKVSVR